MKLIASPLALLISAVSAFAAIDGTVINRTTDRPAANIHIALIRPGQNGMTPVAQTTSDATGRFHFETNQPAAGPQLLQADIGGIHYNQLLTPNMSTERVELAIYDSTPSPKDVRILQRMLIFEPNSARLTMNETVMLSNSSKRTFHDAASGDYLFYLPPAANGQVRVTAQGTGGMPLPRPAVKTDRPDIYKVDYPIKPGDSQLEISYSLPAGTPFTYRGRNIGVKGMATGPLRLIAPQGVTLEGKDIEKLGTEPKTQASVYNLLAHDLFSVDVKGAGGLSTPDAGANNGAAAGAEGDDSTPLTEGQPAIYAHRGWLLGLILAILAVGLGYLYRSSPVRSA